MSQRIDVVYVAHEGKVRYLIGENSRVKRMNVTVGVFFFRIMSVCVCVCYKAFRNREAIQSRSNDSRGESLHRH